MSIKVVHRTKYKRTISMDYGEWGCHAWGVFSTQYTSPMGTERMKQEEKADTRIIQGLTSPKDLTLELHEGHESSYLD